MDQRGGDCLIAPLDSMLTCIRINQTSSVDHNVTITAELAQRLSSIRGSCRAISLLDLFNPQRASTFALDAAQLTLDFSKQFCTTETLTLFDELCTQLDLRARINDLFNGATVNRTEQRPALHTSLRAEDNRAPNYSDVTRVQTDMHNLVDALLCGTTARIQ